MADGGAATAVRVRGPSQGTLCDQCPFAQQGKPNRPVWGEGPAQPAWIIVGEGPGQVEVRAGRPFVGPTGQLLNKALAKVGVDRETLWLTNATACMPPLTATDTHKKTAAQCCLPRLDHELASKALHDKPVLALGAVATQALVDSEYSITKIAGTYNESRIGRQAGEDLRAVIPTIHPAAILRGGSGTDASHSPDLMFWSLLYDIQKVVALAQGRDIRFREDILPVFSPYLHSDPKAKSKSTGVLHYSQIVPGEAQRAMESVVLTSDEEAVQQLVPMAHHATAVEVEGLMESIVRAARALRFLAIDLETYTTNDHDPLEAPHAKIRCIGLATPYAAASFSWDLLTPRALRLLRSVLVDTTVTRCWHNSLYDRPVLAWNGFLTAEPNVDTMLLHHNAFPGLAHGLQRVASQFFAIKPWKSDFREGDETVQELVMYNGTDVLSTARLVAPLQACVKRSQAERTWQIDEIMARVALRMHMVGVPVDRNVNRALAGHFDGMIAQSRRGIEAKASDPALRKDLFDRLAFEQAKRPRKSDPPDFIQRHGIRVQELEAELAKGKWSWLINSGEHVVAYLRARGVPMPKVTEKGRTSTDKDVLESLSHLPEVRDLLVYRANQKLLSTFIDPMIYYMDTRDRVHPMWSVNAITGRWKADKPATMNTPKGDQIWPCAGCLQPRETCTCKGGFDKMAPCFESWSKIPPAGRMTPNVRWQVRARRGTKLVAFDYKQLEARIIALYSGEPFLLDVFRTGKDIHDEFSKIIWPGWATMNVDVRKELRDLTKRVEFAGFYGAAVDTAYENIRKDKPNVKRQDIAAALDLINRKLLHVQAWHAQLIRDAMQKGEIRSAILGRRTVFPLGNADPSVLYNFPVQAAAADLIDLGLAEFVKKKPKGAEPILHVHDSLVIECVENDLDKTVQAMRESFEQEHTIGETTMDFPIDLRVGESWGEV